MPRELVRFGSGNGRSTTDSAPDPKALLNAFRRRWLLAMSLGLVCGLGVAACAWKFVPAPFRASSELRISSVTERILFKPAEQQATFHTYKQTQMRLLMLPFVLNNA